MEILNCSRNMRNSQVSQNIFSVKTVNNALLFFGSWNHISFTFLKQKLHSSHKKHLPETTIVIKCSPYPAIMEISSYTPQKQSDHLVFLNQSQILYKITQLSEDVITRLSIVRQTTHSKRYQGNLRQEVQQEEPKELIKFRATLRSGGFAAGMALPSLAVDYWRWECAPGKFHKFDLKIINFLKL